MSEPVEKNGKDEDGADNGWADFFPDLSSEESQDSDGSPAAKKAHQAKRPVETADSVGPVIEDELFEVKADKSDRADDEGLRDFDAAKISQAFADRSESRPPFMPKGFDSRPEHIPLLGALLSALAPGSGQIYNGQPDKAQRVAVTFFLIYPWVKAVRQAWERGEKVRTYYAPRPDEGAVKRAFVFGAKWWLVMLVLIMASSWSFASIQDYRERQQQQYELIQVRQLIYYGQDVVEDGVFDALQAANAAEIEVNVEEEKSGMDDAERARRLYIIGYHSCLAGEFETCAAAMRRVTSLVRDNRDAFRLQAWAHIQAQGEDRDMEMPDVGEVPTLEEFELELAVRGEDLEDVKEEWWDDGRDY